MGLFSFLKNAGSKLFGGKEEVAHEEANHEEIRIEKEAALKKEVLDLGLDINYFEVSLDGDTVTLRGETECQEEKEKVILAVGNVNGIATVVDEIEVIKPEPEAVFYEVKSGDSLSKIAKSHYGNAMKYNIIFEANKPMLKHPDKIYPGQMLRIPPLAE